MTTQLPQFRQHTKNVYFVVSLNITLRSDVFFKRSKLKHFVSLLWRLKPYGEKHTISVFADQNPYSLLNRQRRKTVFFKWIYKSLSHKKYFSEKNVSQLFAIQIYMYVSEHCAILDRKLLLIGQYHFITAIKKLFC